ncbi:DNA adenine methylase [Clostridiales Family XIII bacterium ASD5510]|uniref:DNA adenine methylase n=1 Tax=Hominibacterium faecale TaxID=2839743 RepID=A0A9J6QYE8_9FIRM|nr:DNA adenine methylase [Hominibacterium faecale]MCU7380488.1 DNA adenine methylase [Hominibacterium faecale]
MKNLLHYPGSKKRISPWIIKHMPPHHSYLEPYFGGGSILFNKTPARIETVNDLDQDVVNFFRVLRDPASREQLQEYLAYTPYARVVYDEAWGTKARLQVERAASFAIRSMQGHGFRSHDKTGWKKDVYGREAAYAVRYYNELPEALASMAARLKEVQIECRPALELIEAFDRSEVLIYADPPYVLSTRGRKQYRHEMMDADHRELLEVLCQSRAKVMLSGYDNKLYDSYLSGWRKEQIAARAQNSLPRVETLWMNFEPMAQMRIDQI